MKTFTKTLVAFTVAVCGLASFAPAQSPHNVAMELQRVRQQFSHQHVMPSRPLQPHVQHPVQQISHFNPHRYPAYQQYPVYVSPDRFNGINPHTGGVDTKNEQVDNSYYDRFRETSKNNGTRRWVRRPIYDGHGNVKGYQEGYVWTNSVTGVEHGELKNVTSNDKGGVHEQIQIHSVRGR